MLITRLNRAIPGLKVKLPELRRKGRFPGQKGGNKPCIPRAYD